MDVKCVAYSRYSSHTTLTFKMSENECSKICNIHADHIRSGVSGAV